MNQPPQSVIVATMGRALAGLIQLFACYVVFHGHYSPGGGFQGGALLAGSILLLRMTEGRAASQRHFPATLGPPLGAAGVLIYLLVGAVGIMAGHGYLDYAGLPLAGWTGAEKRNLGILLVELGVALAVMGTLISIFDNLMAEDPDD